MTDEKLFEKISGMIADILAAYFVNIVRIARKCHLKGIEERERRASVRLLFSLAKLKKF